MRAFLILAIMCMVSVQASFSQYKLTDEDLRELDREIAKVPEYDNVKFARIDSLKNIYNNDESYASRIDMTLKLGKEYESFISDSSYVYYEKALAYSYADSDSVGVITARIGLAKVLGVSGLFQEAVEELNDLESHGIPYFLKKDFYDCARQVYSYMMDYTESNPKFSVMYFTKNRIYRDLLCSLLSKDDPLYRFYYSEEIGRAHV